MTTLTTAAYADSVATLGGIVGDVKLNQGSEFFQAKGGEALSAGDRILVMEGGATSMVFSDGCKTNIAGGTLVTVPPTSPCKGAQVRAQQFAPSDNGAVGGNIAAGAGDYSTVNAVGWTWMGAVAACFIWCRTEDGDNTVSP
jgi:hypothetical protein